MAIDEREKEMNVVMYRSWRSSVVRNLLVKRRSSGRLQLILGPGCLTRLAGTYLRKKSSATSTGMSWLLDTQRVVNLTRQVKYGSQIKL